MDGEGPSIEGSIEVIVAVRPESIQKASGNAGKGLQADIYLREDLGAEEIIYLNVGGTNLTMLNPSYRNGSYDVGDQISIGMSAQDIFVFEKGNGSRIGRGKENFHV
jgi:ABC-type sugar transport system ATPase subunit